MHEKHGSRGLNKKIFSYLSDGSNIRGKDFLFIYQYLPVQILKKRMLNVTIISLHSVNEWPVFNLKKYILTNILRLLLVRIHCSI